MVFKLLKNKLTLPFFIESRFMQTPIVKPKSKKLKGDTKNFAPLQEIHVQLRLFQFIKGFSILLEASNSIHTIGSSHKISQVMDGIRGFWKYGNTLYKLEKAKLDVDFLKRCKIFDVTPKFLRYRLYKLCLHKSAFYNKWQWKLLNLPQSLLILFPFIQVSISIIFK